jgi:3-deoxy-D-manno-octulosonic-acid transferase
MYFLYNILLVAGFFLLTPLFLFHLVTGGKWSDGFWQRLGSLPDLNAGGRRVVLLHCVSVGEANAALPLAVKLKEQFPELALVVSTTTRTGQKVARERYAAIADAVVYFPFDLGFSVRRFLRHVRPAVVLLTETEIWPNFIRRANRSGARLAIVNGRLSERSFRRYSHVKGFLKRVLAYVDLGLMQTNADAQRIMALGMRGSKVKVTGNLKFDLAESRETELTYQFRRRFGIGDGAPLIIAASTHEPEEQMLLEAFKQIWKGGESDPLPRMMIVPRHPERFEEVTNILRASGFAFVRRSEAPSGRDKTAEIILLDSIGELNAAYPLAEVVFVGGSLIPHGGQSVFEPAAAGRSMVTGPHTANFAAAVEEFVSRDALVQLSEASVDELAKALGESLGDADLRRTRGRNALAVIEANRGAADRTLDHLAAILDVKG